MVKFPTGESDSKNPNGMGWIGRIPWKKWDLWYEYHLFEAQRDIWCMDVYGWLWMVMDGFGWLWMVMGFMASVSTLAMMVGIFMSMEHTPFI